MNIKYLIQAFILTIIFCSEDVFCQNGNIWIFGDSAAIDFNYAPPVAKKYNIKSRGTSATYCNNSGQLLFYSSYDAAGMLGSGSPDRNGNVYDSVGQLMQNGDLIVMQLWYQEALIIPQLLDSEKYYLFSIGEGLQHSGLFYSVIDMSMNGGLGSVIQKNIQLLNNKAVDCISAVKHGNGRDWWIFFKHYDNNNNEIYKFLVTPSGVSGPFIQNIGTPSYAGFIRMIFNQQGNQLAVVNYGGQIETMDFDRCTGLLSNVRLITPQFPSGPWPALWSAEYSPNGNHLYVSNSTVHSYLFQFNLADSIPSLTVDTLFDTLYPPSSGGLLKLAPDGKIYWSRAWYDGSTFNYPYPDTTYNIYNTYLSVINSPDSLGSACDFQPYSFYLGGARTYYGLPNNPNYELGADSGSICDSLTSGVFSPASSNTNFHVYYHSGWEIAFINAEKLTGKNYSLQVFDLSGRNIFEEGGPLHSSYFTKDLLMSGFTSGLYIVSLQTEKERMVKKFVKE